MISYKNNQTAKPQYDFYCETDLDSLDDQPVDYSKKYTDQDSYEDRRQQKSDVNPNQFPTESSQTLKPGCRNYNDEIKVYCIEGTPVTISSASSFCDLREVGTPNSLQKSGTKRCFPSTVEDGLSQESLEVKKSAESYGISEHEPLPQEKDEIKDVKSVTFRDSEDISKASSPLMFSRSSSVCSLNSFEQQSIVDDRSSVSAISALTSGIISPSDLPDSPSELMPSGFTDKTCSPKVDCSKVSSDNECDDMETCEKENVDSKQNSDKEITNSSMDYLELAKCKEFLQVSSNKSERNSEDENDILAQQLECFQESSVDMDEVFTNPEYERDGFILKSERDSSEQLSIKSDGESDEDDELLQHYIKLGMPDKIPKTKYDVDKFKQVEHHAYSQSTHDSQVHGTKESKILNRNSLVYGQTNIIQPSIDFKVLEKPHVKINLYSQVSYNSNLTSQQENQSVEMDTIETAKSHNDSDEDDVLLQQCIQLGMPQTSVNSMPGPDEFTNSEHPPQCISTNTIDNSRNQPSVKFDEDDSDEDDILLQQCIQLGMPKHSEKKLKNHSYTRSECHNISPKHNGYQALPNQESASFKEEDSDGDDILVQQCIQLGMPIKTKNKVNPPKYKKMECHDVSPKNNGSQVMKETFSIKSNKDSDCEEDDILLQNCIKLGMPKVISKKKGLHLKMLNKTDYAPHSVNSCSPNDLRDNCPDGISDEDEEDDLLAKCIRVGMPSPQKTNDMQSRLHNSQTLKTSKKLPLPNQSYHLSLSTESNKKTSSKLLSNQNYVPAHSNTAWISNSSFIDVDSMRIYRTEDTPILSPSASISDLSSLSFNESFLNNSRNSDCSSESDDDELLLQCIRSGMPAAKRALA